MQAKAAADLFDTSSSEQSVIIIARTALSLPELPPNAPTQPQLQPEAHPKGIPVHPTPSPDALIQPLPRYHPLIKDMCCPITKV